MVEIGKYNTLKVIKEVDFGIYLDGGDNGEILMPAKYVPNGTKPDDEIEVFIYSDTEDRLIATSETPLAFVNEFAHLKVKEVNKFGAFLDWGIIKDLLVPFREQKADMVEGYSYIVYIYLDEKTNRLAASAKVNKFLSKEFPPYEINDEVNILIQRKTEIGYTAIIENKFAGLLYKNEVFRDIEIGNKLKAFVKKIREDEKIDLALQKSGYEQIDEISRNILQIIKDNDGFVGVTDKSSPGLIKALFNISKKSFKKAVGSLYKQRIIIIESDGIQINKE
ncbi:MAG: S1-like domain-containing RNA-binding protein [Bacteroidales bacterium]|nr:S1-like domain-containing RNA-binding protein [Bacteroidales bacterium]